MASFTDKTPVFNKYVPQQPVDAMLKVGMYKQQKYEEGYKKNKIKKIVRFGFYK